jgi:hypothetical protein
VQIGRVKVDILVIFDPLASGGVTLPRFSLAGSAAGGGCASSRAAYLFCERSNFDHAAVRKLNYVALRRSN